MMKLKSLQKIVGDNLRMQAKFLNKGPFFLEMFCKPFSHKAPFAVSYNNYFWIKSQTGRFDSMKFPKAVVFPINIVSLPRFQLWYKNSSLKGPVQLSL